MQPIETVSRSGQDNQLRRVWSEFDGGADLLFSTGLLLNAHTVRRDATNRYAWAIPNGPAIDALVRYSPVVEIGAGTGYWAMLASASGCDIIAFDEHPPAPDSKLNFWHQCVPTYFPVLCGGSDKATNFPERSLFLCWPPYSSSMACDALLAYKGNAVIYVGEGGGGCTGDEAFHEELDTRWEQTERIEIPQWWGIHDRMMIYRRKHATD